MENKKFLVSSAVDITWQVTLKSELIALSRIEIFKIGTYENKIDSTGYLKKLSNNI